MVGLLALTLAVGCTDSTGGVATPGDSEASTDSSTEEQPDPSSGGAEPTEEIPVRPRDLSVEGLKPCSLFTQPQLDQLREQLKFDRPPRAHTTSDRYEAPACSLEQLQEPFHAVDVLLVTTEGIGPWLSGERNVDAQLVSVGDYPAVEYKLKGTEDVECVTSVDVADGQQLMVDLIPLQRMDYQQLCQMTEQVATMALQTLQTLR